MFDPVIVASERDLLRRVAENLLVGLSHAVTELNYQPPPAHFYSSSEESVVISQSPGSSTLLSFTTKPACYFSSSSSSDLVADQNPINEISTSLSSEVDEVVAKLQSIEVFKQEESLIWLRKVTKMDNKVKIVRAGFVPLLIDVLKGGSVEAQEHAAGAKSVAYKLSKKKPDDNLHEAKDI